MAIGINSGVNTATALRNLSLTNKKASTALGRISSGLKINQAKDNPAGLIISELLRSQASGSQQALRNTNEAYNLMGIAEGGLGSIQGNLQQMRSLAIHALNSGVTGSGQVQADQAVMNSLLQTVQRTADTTRYTSEPLLNGGDAVTYDAKDPSSLLANANFGSIPANGTTVNVSYAGGAGNQAEKAYLESDFGAGQTTLAQDQEFTVAGEQGSYSFSFAAGTTIADMADAINARSDVTGVNAYAIGAADAAAGRQGPTELRLVSQNYGSAASVRVEQREGGAFARAGETVHDMGQDATVNVNGSAVRTRGLEADVAGGGGLRAGLSFNEGDANATTIAQTGYDQDRLVNADASRALTLENVSGGRQLQLGGGSGSQERESFNLPDANIHSLGQVTENGKTYSLSDLFGGGEASLAQNPELALRIIDAAIADVSSARGDIGSYQANTLQTNANNLAVEYQNLMATESYIRDADLAREITELTQAQLLQQVGMRMVQNANQQSRNMAMNLLGVG